MKSAQRYRISIFAKLRSKMQNVLQKAELSQKWLQKKQRIEN